MKYFNKPNKDPCWFIISYNDYNDQNTLTQIKLMNYNSDLLGGKQAIKGDKKLTATQILVDFTKKCEINNHDMQQ